MHRMTNEEFRDLIKVLFGPKPAVKDVAALLSEFRETSATSVSNWIGDHKPPPAWIDVALADIVSRRRVQVIEQVEAIEEYRDKLDVGVLRRLEWAKSDIRTMRRRRQMEREEEEQGPIHRPTD